MVLLVVSVGAAQDRGMFVGLRQVENCATAVDSMMLQRQNDLYIGQRGSQESMLYNKWFEAPLVYTPMMEAAWSYCQKVVPGDTLIFKVDLLAPVRHGISSMKGYIFVGDHVVAEATFTAQIVKNK